MSATQPLSHGKRTGDPPWVKRRHPDCVKGAEHIAGVIWGAAKLDIAAGIDQFMERRTRSPTPSCEHDDANMVGVGGTKRTAYFFSSCSLEHANDENVAGSDAKRVFHTLIVESPQPDHVSETPENLWPLGATTSESQSDWETQEEQQFADHNIATPPWEDANIAPVPHYEAMPRISISEIDLLSQSLV